MLSGVCTNKPRIVSSHHRNHQPWKRETHHVSADKKRTLCGINCSEWIVMESAAADLLQSNDCCSRCKTKAGTQ